MKQYLLVIIVFGICLLAIACAWGWRISQKDEKIDVDNIEDYINKDVKVYDENTTPNNRTSNTASNNNNTTSTDNTTSDSSEILTLAEIKSNEGKNKSCADVKILMVKYMNNTGSLVSQKTGNDVKIEYKVALDLSKASSKLTEPAKSIADTINTYLEEDETYDVKISSESANIVVITIESAS